MKLNREEIRTKYEAFLEDFQADLPPINKEVLDIICFIIEKYPEAIDIHPNYTTTIS